MKQPTSREISTDHSGIPMPEVIRGEHHQGDKSMKTEKSEKKSEKIVVNKKKHLLLVMMVALLVPLFPFPLIL